ncbi:hypothetical protein IRJ41_011156 [Triplophysa rosa]|uniref:Uncharacterized protein n=1 Tax=Triplophysa rosa TaxID=992332 RepID=A0A9W7X0Q6_TRIRA|nr:hypothetical protein IRJ41_011156 [Triplophysa rosa]
MEWLLQPASEYRPSNLSSRIRSALTSVKEAWGFFCMFGSSAIHLLVPSSALIYLILERCNSGHDLLFRESEVQTLAAETQHGRKMDYRTEETTLPGRSGGSPGLRLSVLSSQMSRDECRRSLQIKVRAERDETHRQRRIRHQQGSEGVEMEKHQPSDISSYVRNENKELQLNDPEILQRVCNFTWWMMKRTQNPTD